MKKKLFKNKGQLVFKDGHTEDIVECVKYTIKHQALPIYCISTKTGDYACTQYYIPDASPFADDNPFSSLHLRLVTNYFKKTSPGKFDDRRCYKRIRNIKGVMVEGQMCCEVE